MTEQERDESNGEGGEGFSGGTVAAAAGLGVVAGFAIASLWPKDVEPLSGDEAPIRVKNGSLEIQLLDPVRIFEEDPDEDDDGDMPVPGDGKHWRISGMPKRGKPEYTLLVVPGNLMQCGGKLLARGKSVEFVHSAAGQSVKFRATNMYTRIKSKKELQNVPADRRLNYQVGGHISSILIDNKKFCSLGEDSELLVYLLDC